MTSVIENEQALIQAGEFISNLLEQADLLSWYEENILDTTNTGAGFELALVEMAGEKDLIAKVTPSVSRVTANILGRILPEDSTLGFWKGNQFVSISPKNTKVDLAANLQGGLAQLHHHTFYLPDGTVFSASFSASVAHFRPVATLHEAVAEAQRILEMANHAGGDCILAQDNLNNDPAPKPENRTILLAEDDPTTAALIKHRLTKEKYTVSHATTGLKALEMAAKESFGLCLFDIKMPEMDGLEALTHLRQDERYKNTPVIIMTAVADDNALVRAFELGADDFLTKPFSPTELAARVHRLVRTSQPLTM